MIRIEALLQHAHHVDAVADLVWREFWAGVEGGMSRDDLARAFGGRDRHGRVLASLVALDDDRLLGCVHLIDNDDASLPDLHPWLAALVVVPGHRGRGIGTALVQALLGQARTLGFDSLWLGSDGPGFYERLGASRHLRKSADFWVLRLPVPPQNPVTAGRPGRLP